MSGPHETPGELLALLDETLGLIDAELPGRPVAALPVDPLTSLYRQVLEAAREIGERPAEPVRLLHHFASTGGTLIARHLAATPNARLLSEIDPLSQVLALPRFGPSDLIMQYRASARPAEDAVLVEVFLAGLEALYRASLARGERLVLRDHSHSHFCVGEAVPDRPTLREMVAGRLPVRSVVTVRHPLDSFLSLQASGWMHFRPATLVEYARRYAAFLGAHDGIEIIRYEDFVEAREPTLARLCRALDLVEADRVADADTTALTGDSGRAGASVAPRPRRPVPDAVEADRAAGTYRALCERLGYPP